MAVNALKREECLTEVDPMGDDYISKSVVQVLLRRKTSCR